MLAVLLAQTSVTSEPDYGAAAALALVIAAVLCALFALWRRTLLGSLFVLVALIGTQVALLTYPGVESVYSELGKIGLPWLLGLSIALVPPCLLLLWRRSRRFALVWVGLTVVSTLLLVNYMTAIISSIGWVLLLLALWPRWRLLRGAPRGREMRPVVPSRGVLSVHPWPHERGFSLVSSLAGVACLMIAFGLTAQIIGGTTAAIHRADHLAIAADLLESARERTLAGTDAGDLAGLAARALPHGSATLARAAAGAGLVRVTATATWREPTGKVGVTTLEWLARERAR